MKINKYLPFAALYFFFNSLGLPAGLTYTALLAPFFYWWVLSERKKDIIIPFLVVMLPFFIIHIYIVRVDFKNYIVSFFNLMAVYIFCQAAYTFFKKADNPELVLRKLLFINFIFCLIAIPLYFSPYYDILWIEQFLTQGIDDFKRLKLFTYEASYYATLFIPIFFFYFLQILLGQNKINAWLLLPMLVLPYILSFALGVITALLISISVTFIFHFRSLIVKKRVLNIISILFVVVIPIVVALILFAPGSTLFVRIENIFTGEDPSGRGRTSEAFILASKLLAEKSYVWGVGLGQIKILGSDIIRDFYLYPLDFPVIGIPNATAETLTIFGWVGLTLRFLIQIVLFFYTRVWNNYYRLLLFIFMFIYQFTGSFITNIAEYVIWILAFTEVFPAFRVKQNAQQ